MSLGKLEYVSDLVVYLLNRLGVEYVTLNPGATTRGMHESLVTYGGNVAPEVITCSHEEVAVAMAEGPKQGLALMDALAATGELENYHLLHAARADLLRRIGDTAEAAKSYARAIALAGNASERRYLERRLRDEARRVGVTRHRHDELIPRLAHERDETAQRRVGPLRRGDRSGSRKVAPLGERLNGRRQGREGVGLM